MVSMPRSKTGTFRYRVQVIDRALAVLGALSNDPRGANLAQLCAGLQLHKSTVHRLLMVLEGHRLVERSAESGRYRLGLRLFELGSRASSTLDLREHSRPHLSRVLSETQETVHFCILDEGEALYLEKMEPQRSVRMASSVGRRAPVHCTAVGKAMLAVLPEPEVDLILRRHGMRVLTRNTLKDPAELKAQLKLIRSRGYAVDDEENEVGVRCVAAAVRDCLGRAVAAISVSGPSFRMTRANFPAVAKSVMGACRALSAQLGYRAEISRQAAGGAA